MQLVNEQHNPARFRRNLRQHCLEPLLELAPVFRTSNQGTHIQRHQPLVAQALWHVPVDDAVRKPFDNRGLADPGFADEYRIVLGSAGQDLDRSPNLLVSSDYGVKTAFARRSGQIESVTPKCIVVALGSGRL